MGALFRRSDRASQHEVAEPADQSDQSDPTIEVKAAVIAEAQNAGTGPVGEPAEPSPATGLDQGMTEELLDQALAERKALVQLCLYALDRARSSGVAERIEEGLAAIGVAALRPDGQRFDPTHHEAGGTVPATADGTDGVVAETEVVGFADRGRLLRAPIVIVYKAQP